MNYAVEMGSGAVIYISSFIKSGLDMQKLIGEINMQTHRHRQECDFISLLLGFENEENRLKM
jgi:hypothetical protein